jgi:microcystin-dependent protein
MSDPFLAEVRIFGFTFPPRGWAFCNGQLMSISQNTALFALLGTFYGGDGKSTFGLPDLTDGRTVIGTGQGNGLSERFVGEIGGTPTVTLLPTEMPSHGHTVQVSNEVAEISTPSAATAIARSNGQSAYAPPANVEQMSQQVTSIQGGSGPHNNLMPYLTLNFCIALQGVFPQRP